MVLGKFGRKAEFIFLLLVLVLIACVCNSDTLFQVGLVPANDYAANDLLIQDAKSFSLYHGNYSRVGFYHPGPFFFQVMAICELVLVDWFSLLKSPVLAHIFAGFLIHFTAILVLYFSFRDYFSSRWSAAVATCLTVAIACLMIDTRDVYLGQAYFISIWPPLLYMSAATMVLAGLIGLSARNGTWLPTLTCGFMMLIHGHASFVGLVPIMFCSLVGCVALMAILERREGRSLMLSRNGLRAQIAVSIVVASVFLLPIVIGVIKQGPENIEKYFVFAEKGRLWAIKDVAAYLASFWVWPLVFILIELFFSVRENYWKNLSAPVLILSTCTPAILLYAFRGIDTFDLKYPLFWACILVSGAASVSIVLFSHRIAHEGFRLILLGLLGAGSLYGLSLFTFKPVWVGVDGGEFFQATKVLQESNAKGISVRINSVGKDPASIVYVAMLAALDKRTGHQAFCVSPSVWDIAYTERYKCKGEVNASDLLIRLAPTQEDTDKALFRIGAHSATVITPQAN